MAENSVKIKIDGDDSGLQSKLGGIGEKAKASLADVKAGFDMASQAAQKLADASVKVYAGFDDAMRQVQATMNASAQHRVFQSQLLPVWGTTRSRRPIRRSLAQFQSTLPVRGATSSQVAHLLRPSHFNPRSPCGERLAFCLFGALSLLISIHAPHAGSDADRILTSSHARDFNPRSPCGERRVARLSLARWFISIHAPHAGSDRSNTPSVTCPI